MEQIKSRQAIREEGARAAREGRPAHTNKYPAGTSAHKEWNFGFILEHRAAHVRRSGPRVAA